MAFVLSDNMSVKMTIFHSCDTTSLLAPHHDVSVTLTPLPLFHSIVDTLMEVLCKFGSDLTGRFQRYTHFCTPLYF